MADRDWGVFPFYHAQNYTYYNLRLSQYPQCVNLYKCSALIKSVVNPYQVSATEPEAQE